jgi:hypothetical protein
MPGKIPLIGDLIVSSESIGGNLNKLMLQNNFGIALNSTIEYEDGTPYSQDVVIHNLIGATIISYKHIKDMKTHILGFKLRNDEFITLVFKENSRNGFFVY